MRRRFLEMLLITAVIGIGSMLCTGAALLVGFAVEVLTGSTAAGLVTIYVVILLQIAFLTAAFFEWAER